jgi:hypothetical protein
MIWKVSRILYAQHRQDWEEAQAGTETGRHALPQYKVTPTQRLEADNAAT